MEKKDLLDELKFCIKLWEELGHCAFGKKSECTKCAAPYLLWKMICKEHISEPMKLDDWKKKLTEQMI